MSDRAAAWVEHWKSTAVLTAGMSTCATRQVGAIAVRENRLVAAGFNGNLPDTQHCDEGGCPRCADRTIASGTQLELCVCVHAEQNLIAYAARTGARLDGCTLYCTHRPCHACFKLVVSAGMRQLAFLQDYPAAYPVPGYVELQIV